MPLCKRNTGDGKKTQQHQKKKNKRQRRWHHDPVPCPQRPSLGTQLGRGYTEPRISQGWSAGLTSITVMLADRLVRVVTGQGYMSLYARGPRKDPDCASCVSCESRSSGFRMQMKRPHNSRSSPLANLVSRNLG